MRARHWLVERWLNRRARAQSRPWHFELDPAPVVQYERGVAPVLEFLADVPEMPPGLPATPIGLPVAGRTPAPHPRWAGRATPPQATA